MWQKTLLAPQVCELPAKSGQGVHAAGCKKLVGKVRGDFAYDKALSQNA